MRPHLQSTPTSTDLLQLKWTKFVRKIRDRLKMTFLVDRRPIPDRLSWVQIQSFHKKELA